MTRFRYSAACRLWMTGAAALIAVAMAARPEAQSISEPSLKAAFLVNFAKFTEWPPEAVGPADPLVFCVTDTPMADALYQLVSNRRIGQHAVTLTRLRIDDNAGGCALLYTGALDGVRSKRLVATVRDVSVLSVGDSEEFIDIGGIVRFYMDQGALRFAINVDAASRARLHLNAQLLSLATIVKKGVSP